MIDRTTMRSPHEDRNRERERERERERAEIEATVFILGQTEDRDL